MTPTATRILVTGDLHLGRRPTKVPSALDSRSLSCAAMWRAIVDEAIRREVDLVALTGDVVDHENRFFEAVGPLEAGLMQLADAGIPTYAVAGNHDADVLPRLVDSVGGEFFHLLGRDGTWEEHQLPRAGGPPLLIRGWSFPSGHYERNPLDDYRFDARPEQPILGLLHADLDVAESRYAPVMRHQFSEKPATLWALGHVHRPCFETLPGGTPLLYPGSPQAMDPGETGVHGPWLIEIEGPKSLRATQLAMSRIRYESVALDLTGVDDPQALQSRLMQAVGDAVASIDQPDQGLEILSLRLELVGRTSLCSRLQAVTDRMVEELQRQGDGFTAYLEKVTNNTRPAIDLDELARKHDPPGVLAQTLQALASPSPDEATRQLLRRAQQAAREVHDTSAYGPIHGDDPLDVEAVRRRLLRQGMLLLDTLLQQEDRP